MSTNNEYFTVLREQKEAQGESDYLRQLEDAAKMLPQKGKHLPDSLGHISGFGRGCFKCSPLHVGGQFCPQLECAPAVIGKDFLVPLFLRLGVKAG